MSIRHTLSTILVSVALFSAQGAAARRTILQEKR